MTGTLAEIRPCGWKLKDIKFQSGVIPLRPSREYRCTYATDNGVAHFFSEVVLGDRQPNMTLIITAPRQIRIRERRTSPRLGFSQRAILNDGQSVFVRNMSPGGALLVSDEPFVRGSDFDLRLEDSVASFRGVVLDSLSTDDGYVSRVRFDTEAPLDLIWNLASAAE
jgi:hypothetical protein